MIIHNKLPLWIVLAMFWNLVAFTMIMLDKRRAKRNEWRIRERTFFLWAMAFGATGILLGMYVFRHKIRHWSFVVGMPIIWIFNLVCGCFVWRQAYLTPF